MAGNHMWQGGMCGREACVAGRHMWQGGVCDREACVAGRRVLQGVCVAERHV